MQDGNNNVMKITVDAKAGAKREGVIELAPQHFRVAVHEPPVDGKANAAIVRALAKHLGLAPSCLVIVSGASSRRKIVEVET